MERDRQQKATTNVDEEQPDSFTMADRKCRERAL